MRRGRTRPYPGGICTAPQAGTGIAKLAMAAMGALMGGPALAAEEGIAIRLYSVQASGLSTYDCSIQLEVHNRMAVTLDGFAATLGFFDAAGAIIAQKPFEMTRIRPSVRRREGLGFKLSFPAGHEMPQAMTELVDQCDVLDSADIVLRACEGARDDMFSACQSALFAHPGTELPLNVRRDGVEEVVDYGVVALPQGFRADVAERAILGPLGLTVSTITEELAWTEGLSPVTQGLLVVASDPEGPADFAGVQAGDVISEFDQDVALSAVEAEAAVAAALNRGARSMLLLLDRGGEPVFAVIRLVRE